MAWPLPRYSRSQVKRAGKIIRKPIRGLSLPQIREWVEAIGVVSNWRSCHGYPINTFQATLRQKLKKVDPDAIVAQRLKRMPSIIAKLERERSMQLVTMQDIGGLRAVVSTVAKVRQLEKNYRESKFSHELVDVTDYIDHPKPSGYRSVHLIYRYKNRQRPSYNGLLIEIQLRSKVQHAWATAVETMGTFLNHSLKASEGPEQWLDFFALAGSAFAYLEKTPPVPGYENLSDIDTFRRVIAEANDLDVVGRLAAFSIAAERISSDKRPGSYHIIELNTELKQVSIRSYSQTRLAEANEEYARLEKEIAQGSPIQAVLVSAGPIGELRRAYPNYFLDTNEFIRIMHRIQSKVDSTNRKVSK